MWTLQTRVPCVALVRFRLGASRCNRVSAFCPLFSGLQTVSYSLSTACQISLSTLGEVLSHGRIALLEHYRYALRSAPTPPCGVPCSGNPGLTPDLRQQKIPVLMPFGAMSLSIVDEWLILSKHFSMSSSSITRFSIPLLFERRLWNSFFWASCAALPVLNP